MIELTEQQEQEMIDRAKAGDPEANYQMSLWALEQSMAEPDEERWNRLAAKCLVKAAEAGYEPAKEKMNELLAQTAEAAEPAPAAAPEAEPVYAPAEPIRPQAAPETAEQNAAQPAASTVKGKAAAIGSAIAAGAGAAFAKVKGLFSKSGETGSAGTAGASTGKKPGFLNFSQWDDAKWKKMQVVCIVICAVLLILLLILLLTGKNKNKKAAEDVVPTPVAEIVVTPEPVTTPEPALYPDAATRGEIEAADLETYPEDGDYVDAAKTVTVSTSGSVLNLRRGAGQSYGQVGSLPNGATVDVYAYKNGWALVQYNDTWGWCSNDYLK